MTLPPREGVRPETVRGPAPPAGSPGAAMTRRELRHRAEQLAAARPSPAVIVPTRPVVLHPPASPRAVDRVVTETVLPSRAARGRSRMRARWRVFTERTAPFPAFPWTVILPAAGILGVTAVLVAGIARSAGPLTDNLRAFVVDGATPVTVTANEVAAGVTPPAGWSVTPLSGSELRVTSPDGVLRMTITATPAGASDQVPALIAERHVPMSDVVSEPFASGLIIDHFDVGGQIVAVVELSPTASVVVTALASGAPLASYRAEVGRVLAGIR